MSSNPPSSFDVCGPLPTGTTVLEASAGTGKTFTIAALATRYVAEGHAELGELMLVTFGRAATQELRERVREQLVAAERGLADPALARAGDDDLLALLADADDTEVTLRRKRLTTALADFDAATIATTHGFCQQMLVGLGVDGDFEPGATFLEDADDLVVEVVQDLFVRKWGRPGAAPPTMSYGQALSLVRAAVRDRHARLEPRTADEESSAERFRLGQTARAEVEARKRRRRLRDYDDLLTLLLDAMESPQRSEAARRRVRERYRVVLVDEFQDTDPVQWRILELAFHGHTTLVLVGDPKQAIYAFRGGDVVTYLAASERATEHQTLARNWRSDEELLRGLDALFGGAALGHADIVVRRVDARWRGRRLTGAPSPAPLRLRTVSRQRLGAGDKLPAVGRIRALVADDVAADVVGLLRSGARLELPGRTGPVLPGDLAVLVRTNDQASLTHAALTAAGVPAVLTGLVNVYSTPMAREWLVLLQALEQPHRATRVRTAALGVFVGWDAARLADTGDAAMDELGPLLRGWADVLAHRGVPALLEVATESYGLTGRVLAGQAGERSLTDLRHVAESMHSAATGEQLGTSALLEWLQRRIREAESDQAEERSRRLDSDAEAVQVVTVHRSKGLEFPVVYVPFGWDRYTSTPDHPRFHPPDRVRSLDVGGRHGPLFAEHAQWHRDEESGEDLRLLYVALTRAQCQVVTWWCPSNNTAASPLHRLLLGGHRPGEQPPAKPRVPGDDQVRSRLATFAKQADGCIAVEEVGQPGTERWVPSTPQATELAAAAFDRRLDQAWRRTSYTGLTAAAHEAATSEPGVGSEPEEGSLADETDTTPPTHLVDATAGHESLPSPLAHLPAGAGFGLVVHAVLESVDTGAPDLAVELTGRSAQVLAQRLGATYDAETLGAALVPAMATPLGRLAADRCLADVAAADRLHELDFELPLTGGDDPVRAQVTLSAIADLLRERLAPDDPLAGYPDRLAAPELDGHRLRGYLVGSIDAVLRVRTGQAPRHLVVDYKTNWLGATVPGSGSLDVHDYRPDALTTAMFDAHYPLQLLLYLVALHRYLRWRQPGYDPDDHLAGGLYLFLRGMAGPDTPVVDGTPYGVFGWAPPRGLVDALSGLLAGA